MDDTLRESFKTPEIKKKILFSFLIVSVLCLLTIIPIPGLDHNLAQAKIEGWGSIGTILDILSCGALSNASIVSLGIYPFLVASIVMQIVTLAVPKLRNLAQMGDEGTKIITKFTRIAALIGAGVFAVLYCVGMRDAVFASLNFWVGIVLC
jgi:preprotein translocase subunit SecY